MKELDILLPEKERAQEIDKILKNKKRETLLEEECKTKLAEFFRDELDSNKINAILKENKFNGIYVIDDKDYETLFPGTVAEYIVDTKTIIISKSDSHRIDALCHEMIHALINHKLRPLYEGDEFSGIALGLEEGLATSVALKLSAKKSLGTTYFAQVKLVDQLNELYKCNENKEYSSFYVHAILEPEKALPLVKDIYLNILEKEFAETKELENTAYRTSFNLLLASSDLLEKPDKKLLLSVTYTNFLYLALKNTKYYFKECPKKIKEMFMMGEVTTMADKYDNYIYGIFGKRIFQAELCERIKSKNSQIINYIETKDKEEEEAKIKRI